MKEIQVKRILKERELLNKSEFKYQMLKFDKINDYIEIEISNEIIDRVVEFNIYYLLEINVNLFPIVPPRVYCLTNFCESHFSDYRDILEDVIESTWLPYINLVDIINKLGNFTRDYYKSVKNNVVKTVGKFYLGEIYNLKILKYMSIEIFKVYLVFKDLNQKYTSKSKRFLVISDLYFCLYEENNKNNNEIILEFWTCFLSLINVEKSMKKDDIILTWRQRDIKKPYTMKIWCDEDESGFIFQKISEKLYNIGIEFRLKKNTIKNEGSQTNKFNDKNNEKTIINISKLEKKIQEIENEHIQCIIENKEKIQILLNLYTKAFNYYSDIKDEVYKKNIYQKKMNSFLSNPNLSFLPPSEKNENMINLNKEFLNSSRDELKEFEINFIGNDDEHQALYDKSNYNKVPLEENSKINNFNYIYQDQHSEEKNDLLKDVNIKIGPVIELDENISINCDHLCEIEQVVIEPMINKDKSSSEDDFYNDENEEWEEDEEQISKIEEEIDDCKKTRIDNIQHFASN